MTQRHFAPGPELDGCGLFIVCLVMIFFLAPLLHILTVKPVLYLIMYIVS